MHPAIQQDVVVYSILFGPGEELETSKHQTFVLASRRHREVPMKGIGIGGAQMQLCEPDLNARLCCTAPTGQCMGASKELNAGPEVSKEQEVDSYDRRDR
jgi:hypothetical protein